MTLVNSSGAEAGLGPPWSPPQEFDEFRLVRALGGGAMGQVYLAHDTLLDRQVAVKFMQGATDPAARASVLEEARAIARLQHPNVVAIYRVAEVDGHAYLVSEYIAGQGLHELTRPVPWRAVLDIAVDLTRGLAAAHRRGVLHRDVKPANAILADDGRAKLLDFGLATIIDRGPGEDVAATRSPSGAAATAPGRAAIDLAALMADPTQPLTAEANSSPVIAVPGVTRQVVGTPIYIAPELWRGEPATRRSDLYSLGILLYELLTGTAPHREVGLNQLAEAVQRRDIPRLGDVAPEIEPALAAIVDRLIERDPRARFASADALLVALEDSAAPPATAGAPEGNPYRGLAAFDSAHAAAFFGRRIEIRELIDRVRLDPFVVVGGDSGTGKSSLCRAGALPWLADHGGWSCVEVIPGRHPVGALAAALARWTGRDEAALAGQLREDPDAVARDLRKHAVARDAAPGRLLVFVDQLEELLTQSAPREAQVVAAAIAALAVRSPSLRVLATARSDFLSRLAMLPGLGDEMARGLYFLRPLGGDQIREAIVRPAAARGVVYESEALIEELVAHAEHAPGGLPLLQFTLAELWDARDVPGRTIRAAALAALGGVAGALARHADRLLGGLRAAERDAARRILLRLVTAQGTRTRRPKAELLSGGAARDAERTALEALIRGRLVVASNAQDAACELAHEALLTGWSTLQGWLTRDAADHAVRGRIAQAAAEWDRIGRGRELLWGRRQLAEVGALDRAGLASREAAFLAASARAIRWRRVLGAGGATALAIGVVIAGVAIRARARRELEAMIADQTVAATTAQATARQVAAQRDVARSRALGLFDAQRWSEGEDAWTGVEAMAVQEERAYRNAAARLESVLLLDPTQAGLRSWFADLTFERLVRAERDHRDDLGDELAARLIAYGGDHRAALEAARIELTVAPPDTRVWVERPGQPRRPVDRSPPGVVMMPAGSLVLVFEAPGYAPARLPVLLARGEVRAIRVALPAAASAPPGMIYVPPGRFLFGSADRSDARRNVYQAVPLHEVSTAGYFIGRTEVTFAQWIEFLDELAPDERARRTPGSKDATTSLLVTELGSGRWRLSLTPTTRTYTAETGKRLRYERRARRADQDWMKFPVSAVSYDDAIAFAGWLDRTRRVPGARLCDEYEWERAARGADARPVPGGAALAADDANIDATYGREPLAFGPDEVGSHPGSRSPVGADDMAGNVWEWTRSVETPDAPVLRGGSWYQGELSARSMNREHGERSLRNPLAGLRLCATPGDPAAR